LWDVMRDAGVWPGGVHPFLGEWRTREPETKAVLRHRAKAKKAQLHVEPHRRVLRHSLLRRTAPAESGGTPIQY